MLTSIISFSILILLKFIVFEKSAIPVAMSHKEGTSTLTIDSSLVILQLPQRELDRIDSYHTRKIPKFYRKGPAS